MIDTTVPRSTRPVLVTQQTVLHGLMTLQITRRDGAYHVSLIGVDGRARALPDAIFHTYSAAQTRLTTEADFYARIPAWWGADAAASALAYWAHHHHLAIVTTGTATQRVSAVGPVELVDAGWELTSPEKCEDIS